MNEGKQEKKQKLEKKQKQEKKQKRLRRRILFDGFECKGAEEYLQEMAQKGWLLDEIKGGSCYFVPMEPGKLRYAVKVFDGASAYDTEPSETSLTYAEYCEKAGWYFVGSIGKLHFFYEKQSGAVDIETDPKLELKAVVKYVLIRNGLVWLLFPFLIFMNLTSNGFAHIITSYISIVSISMMLAALLVATARLVNFVLWLIPNKRRVDKGERILYRGRASVRFNKWWIVILLLVLALGLLVLGLNGEKLYAIVSLGVIILVLAYCIALTAILRRLKIPGTMNLVITIAAGIGLSILLIACIVVGVIFIFPFDNFGKVYKKTLSDGSTEIFTVSQDKIPITVKDLGISENGIVSNDIYDDHTIFAMDINYSSEYESSNPEDVDSVGIYYEVFASPYSWVMEKYSDEKLYHDYLDFPEKWEKADAGVWNAKKVYCRHDTAEEGSSVEDVRYLVFYQNAVLDFTADKNELDEKDITIICNKLHQEVPAIPDLDGK